MFVMLLPPIPGSQRSTSMVTMQTQSQTAPELASHLEALERDGITALKSAFSREWADQMREDMMTAFWSAIQRPGGAVGRGHRRWYVEVHPQDISGFLDLVTHPWVVAMSEAVLGPEYQIVEIGFDRSGWMHRAQAMRRSTT
jgi:hypothetical protein